MTKTIRYIAVFAIAAGIALLTATGVFAVGSGSSGGGSRFIGDRDSALRHYTILVSLGSAEAEELLKKIEEFDGSVSNR